MFAGEFTGRRMLALVLAFFGVVIAVNAVMAVMASRSWTGLMVANSYVASQHYNEELEKARQQAALGWRSTLGYSGGTLALTLTDTTGTPLSGLGVSGRIGRSTHEDEDRLLTLREEEPGRYSVALPLPAGLWLADVFVERNGHAVYRQEFRIVVGGDR